MKKLNSSGGFAQAAALLILVAAMLAVSSLLQNVSEGEGSRAMMPVKSPEKDPGTGMERSGAASQARDAEPDYAKANIGLKEADDIVWPYGDEFTYVTNGASLFGMGEKDIKFENEYSENDSGGSLTEKITIRESGIIMTNSVTATFDEHRRAIKVVTRLGTKMTIPMPGMGGSNMEFTLTLRSEGDKARISIEMPKWLMDMAAEGEGLDMSDIEIDAPPDGFFYLSGVDTPGFIALMLSAIDLDAKKHPEIWAIAPMNTMFSLGMGLTGNELTFRRVKIIRLEDASEETRQWWKDYRSDFGNYRPPEGVDVIILDTGVTPDYSIYEGIEGYEGMPGVYTHGGPDAVVYIDQEGRLIRVEQGTGFWGDVATLEDISGNEPWWGRTKES